MALSRRALTPYIDGMVSISTDPALLELDVIHGWLRESYWSPNIRRDVVERAFAGSVVVGAYREDGRQVGCARAVTDQATFAWIADVYVAVDARGRGLGRAMVRALLDDPRLAGLRRVCLATRDAHEVYRPLGFGPVVAERWMERLAP